MKAIRLNLTGTKPLMMHNPRLSDPLDPFTQAIKRITSKRRGITEADLAEKDDLEFRGGIYHDDKLGPIVPSTWMRGTLIEAGKITSKGTALKRALIIVEDEPLVYRGPRDIDALAADPAFRDRRSVRSPGRIMRTRPCFREWQVSFRVLYDENIIDRDALVRIAEQAGVLIGIGDGRNLGSVGRFTVKAEDETL